MRRPQRGPTVEGRFRRRPDWLDQVDACRQLQRRIRARSDVIRRLLEADLDRVRPGRSRAGLLGDIGGAVEAVETLLQDVR